ncbi:hypothetical protein CYY_003327 [Polysphondylium violaceum]|uniref:ADF-H domain-containing protein n=1 Tax=Polysphondylium violaceum TaxID=133409 RepID=A0A8J4PX54_9MYCE|nr:hypothetical protein CYY_003327 [Polysphondylium violaceum]
MVSISNPAELKNALAQYKASNASNPWIVLGYVSPSSIAYRQSGEGVENMVASLKDNEAAYILIRCQYNEKDPGFKTGVLDNKANLKDIFIAWTGPQVGIIEKGKKTSHVGDAKALLQPFHAEITALNRANFTEVNIKDRAAPLSGSHVIA